MPQPSNQPPFRTPGIRPRTLWFLFGLSVLLIVMVWATVAGIVRSNSGIPSPGAGGSQSTAAGVVATVTGPATQSAMSTAGNPSSATIAPQRVTRTGTRTANATLFTASPTSGAEVGQQLPTPATSSLSTSPPESATSPSGSLPAAQFTATAPPQHVFIIMMENHNWSDIEGSHSAPYINKVLLPQASYAQQYYNPPGNHPSEPNYLWLEGGTNFGIKDDSDPAVNHQSTPAHLVTLLERAGISWKAYQEGISGKGCPLKSGGLYAPKHNPMVYFDNVTGGNAANRDTSAYCISHERPYTELAADLLRSTGPGYSFITPDLCHDMHNSVGCASIDSVKNGDNWLSQAVPPIIASSAYKDNGVLFITWDEGEGGSDGPIGMIVLSPLAKGGGYSNKVHYTHSSTLRTVQEIFGVTPLLGDATNAQDLADLFQRLP